MTPEERELVLGVRYLARSMARKARQHELLDADDFEQAGLAELCRSLPKWDGCMPFERFAWYRIRAGINAEAHSASWKRYAQPIPGRAIEYGVDLSLLAAPEPQDARYDTCVVCREPIENLLGGRNRLYCSQACRWKLTKARRAASNAA